MKLACQKPWSGASLRCFVWQERLLHFRSVQESANIVLTLKGFAMQVSVRKMGNSQGILIPKPILNQLGLTDVADLQVNGNVIEIRSVKRATREGWAQDSARLAACGDDALQWPEFGNSGDAELVW